MCKPNAEDEQRVKRLARYLKGNPIAVMWYRYQDMPDYIQRFTDSDWAGCRRTRRSTSGGSIMFGSHYLKGWSKTQATRALSSAEAELYATVKASCEVIGMSSIYQDFGITIPGSVLGDANAALGMIRRKGIGKTRHIDTSFLWVQEKSASKEIKYGKIPGKDNPADLFTKFLSGDEIDKHMTAMDFEFKSGHDDIALTLDTFDENFGCGDKKVTLPRGSTNRWSVTAIM